ncbi:MAG: 4-hydroxy-tetrahydrodipicolinate synthase, partial [Thermoplasmata archaeon]
MPKLKLEGVYPALVTPFTKEEQIDEQALRKLVESIIEHVDGFVPCGTTGEFEYLSLEERKKVIDIVIDQVKGRKKVIAGTGAMSTRHAIELAKHAKNSGADACLIVTPYFLHPSDKGIYEHYYQISHAVDLPIVLYNIPQTVDAYLPRRVIEDLADFDNVVALKDSSGNLTYTLEVLEKVKGRMNVLIGHDEVVLPALASGCSGMILASAQVFPDIWQKVFRLVKAGKLEEAREEQLKVQKLARIFCRYGGAVPIKAALRMMGLDLGKTRRPLREGGQLMPEEREEIRLELEKIGKAKPTVYESETTKKEDSLLDRLNEIGLTKEMIERENIKIGSAKAGDGIYEVTVDVAFGPKNGCVGEIFALQFTYLKHGHESLPSMLEPNLSVRPNTLIIPKNKIENLRQANIIYGPTQQGIAKAVVDNILKGNISKDVLDSHAILTYVAVHPKALDRHLVFHNIYSATYNAINSMK